MLINMKSETFLEENVNYITDKNFNFSLKASCWFQPILNLCSKKRQTQSFFFLFLSDYMWIKKFTSLGFLFSYAIPNFRFCMRIASIQSTWNKTSVMFPLSVMSDSFLSVGDDNRKHDQCQRTTVWKILLIKQLFQFLRVGKNFRLLMQSCRFFFSRPFHESFKFLKNCPYDFHKILHSHFTPKGAPACAKASKSYDWNVRNIAKISPKMAKISPKTAIFRLFSIFSKTVHTIRTKFSTVILHHIRVL